MPFEFVGFSKEARSLDEKRLPCSRITNYRYWGSCSALSHPSSLSISTFRESPQRRQLAGQKENFACYSYNELCRTLHVTRTMYSGPSPSEANLNSSILLPSPLQKNVPQQPNTSVKPLINYHQFRNTYPCLPTLIRSCYLLMSISGTSHTDWATRQFGSHSSSHSCHEI